jgi:glycosyltransferase involved in cell wall biosynthesis
MKLLLVDNAYLLKDKIGNYYSNGIYNNEFFMRYLKVFDELIFVCKVIQVDEVNPVNLINTNKIHILDLPPYKGVFGLLKNLAEIIKKLRSIEKKIEVAILRMSQVESILSFYVLQLSKYRFLVEVVNDPLSLTNFNFFIRFILHSQMKYIIKKSFGVSYVTEKYLQIKYPSLKKPSSYYSSVYLNFNDIGKPKVYSKILLKEKFRLVHVSNNIQDNSKGHIEVLSILSCLKKNNINAEVTFVGEGRFLNQLKEIVIKKKLINNVKMIGYIKSKKDLIEVLTRSDVFVYPSHSEGLPRVVIEAMYCGLPCIVSNVGGMSELIQTKYIYNFNDIKSFSDQLINWYKNPFEMEEASRQNLITVTKYLDSNLSIKRTNFYNLLKKK